MTRLRLALPLALAVLLVDCSTKELAVETLAPEHTPHELAGDVVRLTLAFNPGAAMSLPVGTGARLPLIVFGCLAVLVIARLLWLTPPAATLRRTGLGLLLGGALGNLASRIFMDRGVPDFIDIGFGSSRFFLFNVADIGVTVGACLLAYALWRGETDRAPIPA